MPTRGYKKGIEGTIVELETVFLLIPLKCAENTLAKFRRQECPSFPTDILSFNSLKEYHHI
jgi:hypothetical protein